MIEVEIQKLTAAIEALTKALLNDRKLLETLVDVENTQQGDETLSQLDKEIINCDQVNFDDDANRKLMQAQRDEQIANRHDATMVAVYGDSEVAKRKQAEDDAMAAIYKREAEKKQTVKKRTAHAVVTTEETNALVEASTGGASSAADIRLPGNTTAEEIIAKTAIKENTPKSPEPEKIAAIITEADLKTMAMEIARADSSARPIILNILGEHGAKTITQLDTKHYAAVHAKLRGLSLDIVTGGAPF